MATPTKVLTKVCHYYFRDQLTMAEIGKRMGMSRHRVGRLLKEAQETGVVRIEIRTPFSQETELERRLESALGLKTSVVVDVSDVGDDQEVKSRTCAAGAEFFQQLIQEGNTIGIGWGSTTFELVNMVNQTQAGPVADVTIVQITGGNKWLSAQFDCQEVTRRLAQKLEVEPILLHAPGIVDNPETREVLLKESSIADTFRHFDAIDIAVVGIGSLIPDRSSTLIASGYIESDELEKLIRGGAVGDVFSYFIREDGKVVRTGLHERMITIGIDQLRQVPTSIGIATGVVKAKAVVAAARGGFVNTMILDSLLAEAVLVELNAEGNSQSENREGMGRAAVTT